jgi:surfactin synthase thioesterase subunit
VIDLIYEIPNRQIGYERMALTGWLPWTETATAGRPALFCLPYAAGSAATFRPWFRASAEYGIQLRPIELPGRGTQRGAVQIDDMDRLIALMADALAPVVATGRSALFGHSLGGLLAAFLARELTARGVRVEHLYISGVAADRNWRNRGWASLSDTELCRLLAMTGATPPEILADRTLMSVALPRVRADVGLAEVAEFDGRLTMAVTAFSGTRDLVAPMEQVEKWRQYCAGPFRHIQYPGGHDFVRSGFKDVLRIAAGDLTESQVSTENGVAGVR